MGLFILTAVISAFLDNVTTILLLSPALFRAAEGMDLDPVPFLMAMVAASNLGGLGTLIGDPPNILIGTAANLSFNAFIAMLGLPALILLIGVAVTLPWRFKWEKTLRAWWWIPTKYPANFL